jgi:hypothetical protein
MKKRPKSQKEPVDSIEKMANEFEKKMLFAILNPNHPKVKAFRKKNRISIKTAMNQFDVNKFLAREARKIPKRKSKARISKKTKHELT